MVQETLFKKLSQKDRLAQLLADGEFHHCRELNDICFRYGARLWDLKKEGHDHEVKLINGVEHYKLI